MSLSTGKADSHFGDTIPPPPENLRLPLAESFPGRAAYSLRAAWLRTIHRKHTPALMPPKDLVKRLLVVQLERLGDLILAEPALRALRMHFPDARRTLVAPPFAVDLFAGSGWGGIIPVTDPQQVRKEYEQYEVVIDLTGRVEVLTARILGKSGIPVRIGLDRGGRGVYFTHPVKPPEITVPTREMYLRLTGLVGAYPEDSIPRLPCGEDRLERGRTAWKRLGLRDPAVLMPGAHYPAQRWDLDGFNIVGGVLKKKGLDVAVICGPGEEELGEALAGELDVTLVNAPSIREWMDLLAVSTVAVCNNTGSLHLAAALGVPTVSTMGPTVPWRWWPVSDAPAIVFRGGSENARGKLDLIDPTEVASAALHLAESETVVKAV